MSKPQPTIDSQPIRRALLSVSDKTGIIEFASFLHERGVELLSTGGTARALAEAGLPVRAVDDLTGFPEIMDGRVKTLHPKLHGGLLGVRENPSHLAAMQEHGIEPIDLVCVNLYPFEQTVARNDVTWAQAVEQIDIGGPAMVRAAAKNHRYVTVVVEPAMYVDLMEELTEHDGCTSLATRAAYAAHAYAHTAMYDSAVASWLHAHTQSALSPGQPVTAAAEEEQLFPEFIAPQLQRVTKLAYGENPHQQAALYRTNEAQERSLLAAQQLHGKALSFNNLLDLNAAVELVSEFADPACVIIKHNTPCGCALGETISHAYQRAFAADPLSAFGGIIACNRPVDAETAQQIYNQFAEAVIAPAFAQEALTVLESKPNLRLLTLASLAQPAEADDSVEIRMVAGGALVQQRDQVTETAKDLQVVSARQPSDTELIDAIFAWKICRHVRSNAIVIVKDGASVGIGAGQMSRVDAVKIALDKAAEKTLLDGAVLASDAFFPFADGPQLALDAGIRTIIQPGGSKRDNETIAAVEQAGATMVFAGRRHFRH